MSAPMRHERPAGGGATAAACRVKICGITTADDARLCHVAGAHLLGVILAPSPRQVSPDRARAIREAVPGAKLVGVVTDVAGDRLAVLVAETGVDMLQLHGCADAAVWRAVAAACACPVLPAVTADQASAAVAGYLELPDVDRQQVSGLLMDLPKRGGGAPTGRQALWRAARRASEACVPVMLAGALDHRAMPAAIATAQPVGVDVCRGTERAPGQKDPELVRRVIAAARIVEVPRES